MPRTVTAVFSECKKWYYIKDMATPKSTWMSVRTYLQRPKLKPLEEGIEVRTDDGRKYHRIIKPFMFWELKSGNKTEIDCKDDKVLDYLSAESNRKTVNEEFPFEEYYGNGLEKD